jgi:hypothetical protein
MYKLLYDEKHRMHQVSSKPEERTKLIQKGKRERLLCHNCEQFISPLEKYVKEVLYDGVKSVSYLGPNIEGIDYITFKLFQLSLLWRVGVSSLDFFSDVSLGPHEERLRKMLLDRNPGKSYEYGCMIIMPVSKKHGLIDLVFNPETLMMDGHRWCRLIIGGVFWMFIVSKHSEKYKNRHFFLSEQGRMVILKTEPEKGKNDVSI